MFLKNSKYLPFAGHGSDFVFNMLQAVGESSDGRSVYKQQGGDNFLFYLVKHLQIVNDTVTSLADKK